jgi:superfamily II DNA or RNA helicase
MNGIIMIIDNLSQEELENSFQAATLLEAEKLAENGAILKSKLSKDGTVLAGEITNVTPKKPFTAYVMLDRSNSETIAKGMCTCPEGTNCSHVAALLIQRIRSVQKTDSQPLNENRTVTLPEKQNTATLKWLASLDNTSSTPKQHLDPSKEILFILEILKSNGKSIPFVAVYDVKVKPKNRDYGAHTPFNWKLINEKSHLVRAQNIPHDDATLLKHLQIHSGRNLSEAPQDISLELSGKEGARLLLEVIRTNRCFPSDYWRTPFTLTDHEIEASPAWKTLSSGEQLLTLELTKPGVELINVDPLYYADFETLTIGPIKTGMPSHLPHALLNAPAIHPLETSLVSESLAKKVPNLPPLQVFKTAALKNELPKPILYLMAEKLQSHYYSRYSMEVKLLDFAVPLFEYGNRLVPHHLSIKEIFSYDNSSLNQFNRQKSFEDEKIQELVSLGMRPATVWKDFYKISQNAEPGYTFGNCFSSQKELDVNWHAFLLKGIKQLKQSGWIIEIDPSFTYPVIHEVDEWFTDVLQMPGENWFEMELGVIVEGEKVNLLPLILNIVKENPGRIKALEYLEECVIPLPDGRSVTIPAERLRTILGYLKNLYDLNRLEKNGKLRFENHQASELAALQELMESGKVRWHGGEKLIELGNKLKSFKKIQTVQPPKQFQTPLRDYQKEGLNWLQFLREYCLSGILADDMGLGKTVQVLAHLALEKEEGRQNHPCLIVAPTSLVSNWASEAARFAPDLKVIVLHGMNRNAHFDTIQDYDLVITTYALLHRDQDILLANSFYYLVLDEAQSIKNAASKASRLVNKLQAEHRLCMTGTPLENHLGELWSLFHFLMPGFLGDNKEFGRFFRKPIEMAADNERREALVRRVSPFILRRTKDEVLAELPPKTEIIKTVEMEQDQLDLYEAIRIGMHEKIQKEIEKNGIAKSQIYLLDGLLKLRQACCDPRLVKLEGKKEKIASAKLDLLMELLPELIEEGRKILLFSQFTSMLSLIEEELTQREIPYVSLTGSTVDRATPINRFQEGEVPLFLISLKAGGVGLNLTAADTVIHYDPWWNPAAEKQATDRAHRMGQEKPVFVYKLLTKGTVEEKINRMQEKKQDLADGILSGKASKTSALTVEDVQVLFEPIQPTQ